LCIIAGYSSALDKCFFSLNEGLKRRFTFQYDITGYTYDELMEIFLLHVHKEGWKTEFDIVETDAPNIIREKEIIRMKVKDFFKKNHQYFPHFGGDVESFILNCKVIHGKRVLFLDSNCKKTFTLYDIDKGFTIFVSHRKYKNKQELPETIRSMYV
jgi:hypothetical protein